MNTIQHTVRNPKQLRGISKLRKIARKKAMKILTADRRNAPVHFDEDDIRAILKFLHESAFYIEEFEKYLGEELNDFWEMREHCLRIITGQLVTIVEKEKTNLLYQKQTILPQ